MSTNNVFSLKRFGRLLKQNFIHNNRMMLYASVGYFGLVFFILFLVQLGSDFVPNSIGVFLTVMAIVVPIVGILYIGYSFPAFRSREKTFSYLTLPASSLEKFLFEIVNRILVVLIILPILYWMAFNLEGFVFQLFRSDSVFSPIGFSDIGAIDISPVDQNTWLQVIIMSGALLVVVMPFTGAATFSKQPLIKTLFSIALIFIFYIGYAYIAIEPLGVGKYNPNDSMVIFPTSDEAAFRFFGMFLSVATLVMLTVSFLKLKEKEA